MDTLITVTMTVEQAVAVRNAIWHYEDDSGADDAKVACSILSQMPEN